MIDVWNPEIKFEGEHETEIDVTGGIGLKARRGVMIAEHDVEVLFVNGENFDRLTDAIEGKPVIGTRIISGNS